MAERESMRGHPSGLPESESESEAETDFEEEYEPAGSEKTLDLYLKLAEDCMGAVQMMPSRKFNNEQCGYLAHKLEVVVKSASSFVKVSGAEHPWSQSSADMARWVSIFKLLLALAKEIERFIQSCCKDAWIQAAMTLANVSEYISSVGFKLELCRVAFCKDCAATGSLTLDQVDDISKAEVEVVEKKASMDVDSLFEKVILELSGENRDLANYLLERLKGIKPIPASLSSSSSWSGIDGGFFGKLYKRVFKRVQQTTLLGRGASANVHKAMWLGTQVAKKTFQGRENPHFVKEADILARLCHPNITSMFCCAVDRRSCSIIMELMDEDLHNLMHRRCDGDSDAPPFSILEVVDIMLQVGEGVKYLHDQKIVHGDLKSMNILVKSVLARKSEIGYVHAKVADFGLSKTKESSTRFSSQTFNTGSTRWMPPEIINLDNMRSRVNISRDEKGPKYPFKRDVYSFGMVCYELLTGNQPFLDDSVKNVKEKILKGERPDLPDHCPEELKTLIKRCWSQVPKERPAFVNICKELKYLKCLLLTGFNQGPHLTIEEPLQVVTEGLPMQVSLTSEQQHIEQANNLHRLTLALPLAPLVPIGSQLTPALLTSNSVLSSPNASIALEVGDVGASGSTPVAIIKARISEGSSNGADGYASTGVEHVNASLGAPYVGVLGRRTSSGASGPVMNRPSVTVIPPKQVTGSSNASGDSPEMMTLPGTSGAGTFEEKVKEEAAKTSGSSNSRRKRRNRKDMQRQQPHLANVQASGIEKNSRQLNQGMEDSPSLMAALNHNSQILVAPRPVSQTSQNSLTFQFGSFEPSFDGVSTSRRSPPTLYPLRTNSAPPNLDEQRREQTRFEQPLPITTIRSTDSF